MIEVVRVHGYLGSVNSPLPLVVRRDQGIQDEKGSIPVLRKSDGDSSCEEGRVRQRQLHRRIDSKAWTREGLEDEKGKVGCLECYTTTRQVVRAYEKSLM